MWSKAGSRDSRHSLLDVSTKKFYSTQASILGFGVFFVVVVMKYLFSFIFSEYLFIDVED